MNKIAKQIFGLTLFLGIFLNSVLPAFAEISPGDQENSYTGTLTLSLADFESNISDFTIKSTDSSGLNNDSRYFDSNGSPVLVSFASYDIDNDYSYEIDTTVGTTTSYTNYFEVKSARLVSSSYLKTTEYDYGDFDPDDTIYFRLRNSGDGNFIRVDTTKSDIDENDDDLDLNVSSFLETVEGEIKISLSLYKVDGTETEEKKNSTGEIKKVIKGTNILADENKSVVATFKITPDGIVFDDGLERLEKNMSNNAGSNQSETVKEIGFSGKGLTQPTAGAYKGISKEGNLEVFIVGITNFALSFVTGIAVLMLIYGGYLWIVDQGDDQETEKAKKIIAGSVIGILLIISAYTIVNTVINLEGNTYDGCDAGFDIGNGTDFELSCDLSSGGGTVAGAGLGGLAGSLLGGAIGGDDGALIGGLLGGVTGAGIGGGW